MDFLDRVIEQFPNTNSVILVCAKDDIPNLRKIQGSNDVVGGLDFYLEKEDICLISYRGKKIHFITEAKLIQLYDEDISTRPRDQNGFRLRELFGRMGLKIQKLRKLWHETDKVPSQA